MVTGMEDKLGIHRGDVGLIDVYGNSDFCADKLSKKYNCNRGSRC